MLELGGLRRLGSGQNGLAFQGTDLALGIAQGSLQAGDGVLIDQVAGKLALFGNGLLRVAAALLDGAGDGAGALAVLKGNILGSAKDGRIQAVEALAQALLQVTPSRPRGTSVLLKRAPPG